jgi:hypothetical protein
MSKHDEQTISLIRDGLAVVAIEFLRDNTRCDLSVAKEMVERMSSRIGPWGGHVRHAEYRCARLVRSYVLTAGRE